MSEQQTEKVADKTTTIEPNNVMANPFDNSSWVEQPVKVENVDANINTQQKNAQISASDKKEDKEQIPDYNLYLKDKLGYEDWDSAITEIAELKKIKENVIQDENKFYNEKSKKFIDLINEDKEEELFKFLDEKRKIDRLSAVEIKDTNTAADIIKLNMYQKNKSLESDEIDFLFNKKFQFPDKPQIEEDELESDYSTRISNWEKQVEAVKKEMIIEAKMAKPELEKLKTEIKFPELKNGYQQNNEPDPEVLEMAKKYEDNYLNTIKKFEGFKVEFKDEDVNFSIPYTPSEDEKLLVEKELKKFAEKGLDANALLAPRWVNKDKTINIDQMAKDLFILQNSDKISQKFVNDAVNKRMSEYRKQTSNIHLNNGETGTFNPSNTKSEMDELAKVMFTK